MILVVLYIVIFPISWCEQKLLTGWMERLKKEKANNVFAFYFLILSMDAIACTRSPVTVTVIGWRGWAPFRTSSTLEAPSTPSRLQSRLSVCPTKLNTNRRPSFTVRVGTAFSKGPTSPQVCCYTTLWNANVLIENKTTSVTTHFKSASSSSKADTLNIWCNNCRVRQLLYTITETIITLFPVVTFLKCVVAEFILFSVVDFRTLTFHNSLDVCRIFSDSIKPITNVVLIQTVKSIFDEVKA